MRNACLLNALSHGMPADMGWDCLISGARSLVTGRPVGVSAAGWRTQELGLSSFECSVLSNWEASLSFSSGITDTEVGQGRDENPWRWTQPVNWEYVRSRKVRLLLLACCIFLEVPLLSSSMSCPCDLLR